MSPPRVRLCLPDGVRHPHRSEPQQQSPDACVRAVVSHRSPGSRVSWYCGNRLQGRRGSTAARRTSSERGAEPERHLGQCLQSPYCWQLSGRAPLVESGLPAYRDPLAPARHPCGAQERTPYRCFLPDLTGFRGSCRAGPNPQHLRITAVPRASTLGGEFDPAMADRGCRAPPVPHLARPITMLPRRSEIVNLIPPGPNCAGSRTTP